MSVFLDLGNPELHFSFISSISCILSTSRTKDTVLHTAEILSSEIRIVTP